MLSNNYFTIQEFAENLKVSTSTVYSYIKQDKIDAEKVGKNYKLPNSEKIFRCW
jgi:excisionase family DNA binding protein